MFAQQREFGVLIVIEDHVPPGCGLVAAFTFRAVATLVNVLVGVAVRAGDLNALVALTGMAGLAAGIDVAASQRELGLGVVVALDFVPGIGRVAV